MSFLISNGQNFQGYSTNDRWWIEIQSYSVLSNQPRRYDQRDRILVNSQGMTGIIGIRVLKFSRISSIQANTRTNKME